MRILLDNGVPYGVIPLLSAHDVIPAARLGWHQLRNGELLRRVEAEGFDVLITNDKNMSYQQSLRGHHIAVLVLSNCQWPVLKEYAAALCRAIEDVRLGEFQLVEINNKP